MAKDEKNSNKSQRKDKCHRITMNLGMNKTKFN